MANHLKNTDLEKAFIATAYFAFLPGMTAQIRIGKISDKLDQWLESNGYSTWSFITPYNPQGHIVSGGGNASRYNDLVNITRQRNWGTVPAEAKSDTGDWPAELGLIVFDVVIDEVEALAVFFNQLAIVRGNIGAPARLIWL